MPGPTALVVSDAHLGHASPAVTDAFHRFLAMVPDVAHQLVINGDLFDFWFEYRTVIPRSSFRTLAALQALRRTGVGLTIIGGNHDRWGGAFWQEEIGAAFHPDGGELMLAGLRALVAHGDRLGHDGLAARLLHAITRQPVTSQVFRWIHPDVGVRLVRWMSGTVADETRRAAMLRRAASKQAIYARALLAQRGDLDLVVLGHTHLPALETLGERRWYLNPGAWLEGLRYAEITQHGPVLKQFPTSRP